VIVLQAGAAEHALKADPDRARAAIGSVRATAQDAIGELQTLVRAVRAEAADNREPQPTLADLPRLAEQASGSDFMVGFSVDGEPRAVPAAIQASVYRVAQEGLTNAMKHSGAETCTVALRYRHDDVRIEVGRWRRERAACPRLESRIGWCSRTGQCLWRVGSVRAP
jgi:signal transduction histidine kinase